MTTTKQLEEALTSVWIFESRNIQEPYKNYFCLLVIKFPNYFKIITEDLFIYDSFIDKWISFSNDLYPTIDPSKVIAFCPISKEIYL